jgi:hypothetical protein
MTSGSLRLPRRRSSIASQLRSWVTMDDTFCDEDQEAPGEQIHAR